MPSTAETLQRNWAAARLGIRAGTIREVKWVTDPGWSSDVTEEPESRGCEVWTISGDMMYIDTTDLTFGELLAEVVDSAPPTY